MKHLVSFVVLAAFCCCGCSTSSTIGTNSFRNLYTQYSHYEVCCINKRISYTVSPEGLVNFATRNAANGICIAAAEEYAQLPPFYRDNFHINSSTPLQRIEYRGFHSALFADPLNGMDPECQLDSCLLKQPPVPARFSICFHSDWSESFAATDSRVLTKSLLSVDSKCGSRDKYQVCFDILFDVEFSPDVQTKTSACLTKIMTIVYCRKLSGESAESGWMKIGDEFLDAKAVKEFTGVYSQHLQDYIELQLRQKGYVH